MESRITDHSGTIAAANVSQQVMPAKPSRVWLYFENISAGDMWINFKVPAVEDSPSIKVVAGGIKQFTDFVPGEAVNVIGATLGAKFVAKEAAR